MLTRVEAAGAAAPLQAVRARGVQQLRGKQGGAALQVQSVELMLTRVTRVQFIMLTRAPDLTSSSACASPASLSSRRSKV